LEGDVIIGFLDEASPQTTANTQKFWSFGKPKICKNTSKLKANVFGFYALNGVSVTDFKKNSKKESVCEFLERIRYLNPNTRIIIVLDRYASHRAKMTRECAKNLNIDLVYLPPYSPHLNPIEFIWKSIKRVISKMFIINIGHMRNIIGRYFMKYSLQLSFAKAWIKNILSENLKSQLLGA